MQCWGCWWLLVACKQHSSPGFDRVGGAHGGRTSVTRRMASCASTAAPAGMVASFVASLRVASSVAPNLLLRAMPASGQQPSPLCTQFGPRAYALFTGDAICISST